MDWIQGERFIGLADNTKIFYCHTYDVPGFLHHPPKDEFILISHNGDHCIHIGYKVPNNLIHWFAQNVNRSHPKIESIPIGLENNKWFPNLKKREKMEAKLRTNKHFHNLVYMCHTIDTNFKERKVLYEMFDETPWITTHRKEFFDDYLDNLYNHTFMISPAGNGLDTVRTWECLYMGTYPIEKRNINNQFYTDLPICFVDNWEEITEEFLDNWLVENANKEWNMDKIYFEYWKNKILNYDK
jgi:hypothetical protein